MKNLYKLIAVIVMSLGFISASFADDSQDNGDREMKMMDQYNRKHIDDPGSDQQKYQGYLQWRQQQYMDRDQQLRQESQDLTNQYQEKVERYGSGLPGWLYDLLPRWASHLLSYGPPGWSEFWSKLFPDNSSTSND